MDNIKINFKDNLEIGSFLLSSVQRILAIQALESTLEHIRVANILKQFENDPRYFENAAYLGAENILTVTWIELKNLLALNTQDSSILPNLIIVDVLNYKTLDQEHKITIQNLFETLSSSPKKIILICTKDHICLKCADVLKKYGPKFLTEKKAELCFEDLTEQTQEAILNLPSILLQGKTKTLKEFLSINDAILNNIITSRVISDIILSPRATSLVKIGIQRKNSYIERQFQRKIHLSNKIRKLLTCNAELPEAFIFFGLPNLEELAKVLKTPVKKRSKLLSNENIFVTGCKEEARTFFNSQPAQRSIHLIEYEGNGLTWVASKGPLSRIRPFILKGKASPIDSPALLDKKTVILNGASGTGKSTALKMLQLSSAWIIQIDLMDFQEAQDRIPATINKENVIKYLAYWIDDHFLVSGLLNHYLFNRSALPVYIIFDGYGDIAENIAPQKFSAFLDVLEYLKTSTEARVWITSQPENCRYLENALSEFSVELRNLQKKDCQDFLKRFNGTSENNVEKFYERHEAAINRSAPILGALIMWKIIGDLRQMCSSDLGNYENVGEILSDYVERTIDNFFEENFPRNQHKEEIINYIYAIHGFLAFKLLSSELEELLGKKQAFHIDITKVGFIQTGHKFTHRVFAEYFAAKMFYKWMLDPGTCPMEKFLLLKIFLEPRYTAIRLLLNCLVKQRPPPDMPQCVQERLTSLWQEEKSNVFLNDDCALHVLVREHLSSLIHWFFKGVIRRVLPSILTRYGTFTKGLLPKIKHCPWVDSLKGKLPASNERLFEATRKHQTEEVKKLLSAVDDFAKVYFATSKDKSALHLAAGLGFKDIVEYLVNAGIPVDLFDSKRATPLHYAASNNQVHVVEVLRAKGADVNRSALLSCAEKGHIDVLSLLIGSVDKDNTPVLEYAAKSGHNNIVQLLVDEGWNVNHRDTFGLSALSWTVITGNAVITDCLINAGADSTIQDHHRRNLIHIALKAKQWHVVKYLTFCSIDVNISDWNNVAPLERAMKNKKWDTAAHLILEGAEVNKRSHFDPIHEALQEDQASLAVLMIKRGASLVGLLPEEKDKILEEIIGPSTDEYSSCRKVIRLGNVDLLKLLILRFKKADDHLDKLLGECYEELLLGQATLTENMKSFVEGKLVRLRSVAGQKCKLAEGNVKDRINFIREQIRLLQQAGLKEVDLQFLLRLQFIAQNIELLKRSVRKSAIPWEQMEFCLVMFMSFFMNPLSEDFVYRLVLDQEKLLTYLEGFSHSLELYLQKQDTAAEYLGLLERDFRVMKDVYSLNRISFYIKLALTTRNYEEDTARYVLMRSLQVIGESFKNTMDSPNLSEEVHQYLVLSAPTNVKRIVTSLRDSLSHSHTYKPKLEIERELKSNPHYFKTIQNDLNKIKLEIDFLLYRNKREILEMFRSKCLERGDDPEFLHNVNRYINWECQEEVDMEDYDIKDLKIIRELIAQLGQTLQSPEDEETRLLNQLKSEMNRLEKAVHKRQNKMKSKYIKTRSAFSGLDKVRHSQVLVAPKISFCQENKGGIYNQVVSVLINLIGFMQDKERIARRVGAVRICSQLCYIMKWKAHKISSIEEIDSSLASNAEGSSEILLNLVFQKLSALLEREEDKKALSGHFSERLKLHEELSCLKRHPQASFIDQLEIAKKHKINLKNALRKNNVQVFNNIIGNIDAYGKLLKNYNSDKFYSVLKSFCLPLRNPEVLKALERFIEEEEQEFQGAFQGKLSTLNKIITNNEVDLHKNPSLQAAVEILLLDVMEACLSKGAIAEYVLSYDEFSPLLVGTALRNYLAHGTPLVDVLPFKPIRAIVATAKLLHENRMSMFQPARESALITPMQDPKLKCEKCFSALKTNEHGTNVEGTLPDVDHRSRPLYEYFLQAASGGSLGITEDIINNLFMFKISNALVLWPAVILAAKSGHVAVVETLLSAIDHRNARHVSTGNPTFQRVASCLLPYGINLNETMLNGANKGTTLRNTSEKFLNTALNLAACNGHHKIVRLLLKHHPNLNVSNANQKTILHLTAEKGHEEVVRILLESGAFADALRSDLATPLHLASLNGHSKTAEVLLKHHANVNAVQKDLLTPLHAAAANGHVEVTKVILEHRANVNARDIDGSTALHQAAQNNHPEVAKILLHHQAKVDALDGSGVTALHLATGSGHKDFVRVLLSFEASSDFPGELAPLHVAALYGQHEIARLLLEQGRANVNAAYSRGLTALHIASTAGSSDVVEVLLNHHAYVDAKDSDSFTALHFSAQHGHVNVAKILLKHQSDVNVVSRSQMSPLYIAASHGHEAVVELLLENLANIEFTDSTGRTPLHSAALRGHEAVVSVLLENGAKVNAQSGDKDTPLHYAASSGHESVVKTLIKHYADVNAKDKDLFTALHLAAQNNQEGVAKVLIENKADVNAVMAYQTTPLHSSASQGHSKLVKLLLEKGANIEAATVTQFTALHLSANNGCTEVVEVLLERHANTEAVTIDQATALYLAAGKGHLLIVRALLEHGANVNASIKTLATPLHYASQMGFKHIVEILLKFGARVNASTASKCTPLHLASNEGHGAVVEILLQHGADVNAIENGGETALSAALEKGHENVVKILEAHQRQA